MKPYLKYKHSGIEWIGKIPEHWILKRLKHVAADKKFAIVDGPFGTQLKAEEYVDTGVPLIRISDLDYQGNLSTENIKYITESKADELIRSGIYRNDLIIAKTGATIGKSGINDKINFGIIASSCLKISCDLKTTLPNYLRFLISSHGFQTEMINSSGGSTRDTINITPFSNLFINLPPYSEQQAIANYLDDKTSKIDTLIEKKQRLIALLKEQRTAIINQAVTKSINPKAKMKDTGIEWLGEIPEQWEINIVKRYFQINLGKMLDGKSQQLRGGELKSYLRAANIHWNRILLDDVYKMKFTTEELKRYRLKEGDLLVTEGGVTVGRSAIWKGEMAECYYQNSINRVRPKNNRNIKWLYYWLYFLKVNGFIDLIADKSTFGHLTQEKLEVVPMPIMPQDEENALVNYLDKKTTEIDNVIERTSSTILPLQEYRTALISEVVTGKVDVRGYVRYKEQPEGLLMAAEKKAGYKAKSIADSGLKPEPGF